MRDDEVAIAEFEERGELYVREQLEKERFGEFKRRLAVHWLAERDRASSASAHAENAKLARMAAEAAQVQAEAALEANRIASNANKIATTALIVAVIAIAISIATAFLSASQADRGNVVSKIRPAPVHR